MSHLEPHLEKRRKCGVKEEFTIEGHKGIAVCEGWVAFCCEKHHRQYDHPTHSLKVRLYWTESIKSSIGLR